MKLSEELLEDRFQKIETKLAFLEDFLSKLQEETVRRNAFIDRLGTEHGALKEKLLQLSRDMEDIPNQKPPHY